MSLFDRLMAVKPDGLSANSWRTRAGLSQAVFTDIKRRGSAKHETIEKLLAAIDVSFAEFEAGVKSPERELAPTAVRAPYLAFRGEDRPRDVPIVGTAECADIEFDGDETRVPVEMMEINADDVIDYARRPLSLDNRRDVYAIYFRGTSMSPRYEPGELAYVDPRRPPLSLDYVVLQMRRDDGDNGERLCLAMAKRLVRQGADFFELQQFEPPATFRIEKARVKHIHRIIPWDELVTF